MTTQTEALAIAPRTDIVDLSPAETRRKLAAIAQFQAIVRRELKEGHDYGVIPGTGNKPTLLKPGAEKLAKLLNCFDEYEIIERIEDWEKPLFRYLVRCTLSDMATGTKISSGLGECNSYESKYRYRWVGEDQVPAGIDKAALKTRGGRRTLFEFEFALDKGETTGKYGKPAEYWDAFEKAIKDGTARRVERETKAKKKYWGFELDTDTTLFQVGNPDIFDQVNTILKMAKKRALVDAALSAGRLSDLFTQDIEDLVDYAQPSVEPSRMDIPAPQKPPAASGEPFPSEPAAEDLQAPKPEQATDDQLRAISESIVELRKLGKDDGLIFSEISKRVQDRFGARFAELNELSFEAADFVQVWIGGWVEHLRANKAKRNGKAA